MAHVRHVMSQPLHLALSPCRVVHVVDDDEGVCDSIALVLRQLGHRIITYRDAESLFEAPPPGPSETVIVDLTLPGISGAALIHWLLNLARPPRIVAMSGQSARLIERQLCGLPLSTLLRKPLSVDLLAAAV